MYTQLLRGLHIRNAALLDQAHSLKLELAGKLPSLHDAPPVPSKYLTRCLRNRVQARTPLRIDDDAQKKILEPIRKSIAPRKLRDDQKTRMGKINEIEIL